MKVELLSEEELLKLDKQFLLKYIEHLHQEIISSNNEINRLISSLERRTNRINYLMSTINIKQ